VDLAILAEDMAFCVKCFKCRNCKRKIENLRYARSSQGIFCMSCHESLMARRRKKQRLAREAEIDKTLRRLESPNGNGLRDQPVTAEGLLKMDDHTFMEMVKEELLKKDGSGTPVDSSPLADAKGEPLQTDQPGSSPGLSRDDRSATRDAT
jgi:hypothetical protein